MFNLFRKKKKEIPAPKPPEIYETTLKSLEEELSDLDKNIEQKLPEIKQLKPESEKTSLQNKEGIQITSFYEKGEPTRETKIEENKGIIILDKKDKEGLKLEKEDLNLSKEEKIEEKRKEKDLKEGTYIAKEKISDIKEKKSQKIERFPKAYLGRELKTTLEQKENVRTQIMLFVELEAYNKSLIELESLENILNNLSSKLKEINKGRRNIEIDKSSLKSMLLNLEEELLSISELLYGGEKIA